MDKNLKSKIEKYKTQVRPLSVSFIYAKHSAMSFIATRHPNQSICRISSYNRSLGIPDFNHYTGEDILVFDNFDSCVIPSSVMAGYIKDGYPLMLPARRKSLVACYTHVYIVSGLYPGLLYWHKGHVSKTEEADNVLRHVQHYYEENPFTKTFELVELDPTYKFMGAECI